MRASGPSRWQRLRSAFARLEPIYQWGQSDVWRLDYVEDDFSDESAGYVPYFQIQWLGLNFEVRLGRVPPKLSAAEVAERKASFARQKIEREAELKLESEVMREVRLRAEQMAEA